MFCPKCGNQVADGARFCARCGNDLAPQQNQAPQQPQQPQQPQGSGAEYILKNMNALGKAKIMFYVLLGLNFLTFLLTLCNVNMFTISFGGWGSSSVGIMDAYSASALLALLPLAGLGVTIYPIFMKNFKMNIWNWVASAATSGIAFLMLFFAIENGTLFDLFEYITFMGVLMLLLHAGTIGLSVYLTLQANKNK